MRCQHLLIAAAVTALLACGKAKQDPAPPSGPPPDNWSEYDTEDGGYTVWMPAGAETHSEEQQTLTGTMRLWFMFVNVPGDAMYMLGVATLPPGSIDDGTEDVFFDAFVRSEHRAAQRDIGKFEKGKAGANRTRWIDYTQEGGVSGKSRAVLDLRRNSVYSLTVFWNDSDGTPEHAEDFLRSFQPSR